MPAETADGTTKHVPITDRHGRELTLDTRPETRPEARVLALEVVASHDPHDVSQKNKRATRRRSDSFRDDAPTRTQARSRYDDAVRHQTKHTKNTLVSSACFETCFLTTQLWVWIAVGWSASRQTRSRTRDASPSSRPSVARFFALGDLIRGSRTHIPKQDGHLGFHPSSRDGPVVACAFLDSEPNIVCVFRTFIPARRRLTSRRSVSRERSESCVSSTDSPIASRYCVAF